MKLLLAAVASIALFVGLFVYPGFLRNNSKPPVAARQDSNQLNLRVERANGELLLTWSPDAEIIKNASKAVLSIADGEQKENVPMDLAEMAKGKIMYSPSGKDIRFEMAVTDKSGKTNTETQRIVLPPSPLQESTSATAKTPSPAATTKPATGLVPPGATPNPNGDPAAEQPAKPAPAPLRQFKTESLSQRLRPAAPTDMADAPTVSAGSRPNASAIPGVNMNAFAPAPAAPTAPASPAASSPAAKSGGQIQQAVLIYRKDAEYPKIAKQTGAKGVVKLNATIGTDGTIKKVKVLSGHPMLTNAAMEAVKQWRYRPTLLNGQPVETDTQVLVNFLGDR
jgi:protein TonB